MRLRRHAAPALLLALALAGCKGEPVAATTPNALTTEKRADLAMQLVDAAGTSDGAAGAGLAASVIMSGAQVTRVTATRAGFSTVARVGDTDVAANVASTAAGDASRAEGAVYNVIAFQMIEAAFRDTIMGIVAWDVTPSGTPTSFVVAYSFGEGTGHFDAVDGGPTAYGYVFKPGNASWTATSGTMGLLRKGVGGDCEQYQYPGVVSTCHVASFTGALNLTATAPTNVPANTATGAPTFAIPTGPLNGISIEVTPSTASAVIERSAR